LITDRRLPWEPLAPPIKPTENEPLAGGKRTFRLWNSKTTEADLHATILSFVTVGVSLLFRKKVLHVYKIPKDTTYSIVPDRSNYLDETIKQEGQPLLQSAIKKRKNMYMIVGLKVAHGATVTHQKDDQKGFTAKGNIPVNPSGDQVGGGIGSDKEAYMWDTQKLKYDFVYAYRLKKCVRLGNSYALQKDFVKAEKNLFSEESELSSLAQSGGILLNSTFADGY
jgi:hypothetical protein